MKSLATVDIAKKIVPPFILYSLWFFPSSILPLVLITQICNVVYGLMGIRKSKKRITLLKVIDLTKRFIIFGSFKFCREILQVQFYNNVSLLQPNLEKILFELVLLFFQFIFRFLSLFKLFWIYLNSYKLFKRETKKYRFFFEFRVFTRWLY